MLIDISNISVIALLFIITDGKIQNIYRLLIIFKKLFEQGYETQEWRVIISKLILLDYNDIIFISLSRRPRLFYETWKRILAA